jgi:hypothetical protein
MPFSCEFANDITIGGYDMKNSKKGHLSVWILSNSGKLFFRENVSFINPEGDKWKEIQLPDNNRGLSISCDELGNLWLVTTNGNVLYRTNANSDNPSGTDWVQIDNEDHTFSKISCNSKFVYVLDYSGYVYLRNIEENKWTRVLKELCNISVSLSNKVIN